MKLGWLVLVVGLCLNIQALQAASLEAGVQNSEVPLGEVFTLNISYDGDDGQSMQPDLSALNNDFTVYSTSSSTQISMINGAKTQRRDWDIGLMPKNEGKVVIPAITVGKYRTEPIELTVVPMGTVVSKNVDNVKNDNTLAQTESKFAVDLTVDDTNPYVQQQVNAVLTIKDGAGLQLTKKPSFINSSEWVIKNVGTPEVKQIDGKNREIKFNYALFPQKSGKLDVPAVNVEGYYISMDDSTARPVMQGGVGGFFQMLDFNFDNVFGVQKPVSLFSKPISMEVKPIAAGYGDNWWLPAKALSFTAYWKDGKPKFEVGETVTREIVIAASGISDTQLPELTLNESAAFKQYPENPQLSSSVYQGEVVAQSIIRIVYIPQQGGEQIIPEIRLPWFNVQSGKNEVAVIPEEKVWVEGNAITYNEPSKVAAEANSDKGETNTLKESVETSVKGKVTATPWLLIGVLVTAAFGLGLLFSFLVFNHVYSKREAVSCSQLYAAIKRNLENKDYRALRDNLLKWGNENCEGQSVNNLNELSTIMNSEEFTAQMNLLNSILYAGEKAALNKDKILNCLKSQGKKNKKKQAVEPLPQLYK